MAAAHKQGIIHRDLKPGNVMLIGRSRPTGSLTVKLLDFGLARLTDQCERPAVASLMSTLPYNEPLTGRGAILGTLPYMAPEQLEGREADVRTDLFAFGAIVFEMVTGRRALGGSTPASLTGAILEREPPPMTDLQPLTPLALARLVRKCLAKSPDDRWCSTHDVADELRWIAQAGAPPTIGQRRRLA